MVYQNPFYFKVKFTNFFSKHQSRQPFYWCALIAPILIEILSLYITDIGSHLIFKVNWMKKFWKYLLVLLLVLIVIAIAFLFRPITSKAIKTKNDETVVDAVLVGGGIMSATLGTYLNELQPDWNIRMYERLDAVAQESSNGFNNAGTGHSGFMEMNYTEEKDGKMDISKAVKVASQFEIAKQFWAYCPNLLAPPNLLFFPFLYG